MLTIKDFRLGRISFPTIEDQIAEMVGDSLDVVGAGLAASERRPRSLELTIPVRASSAEANPYSDGDRMRRQVRSLMENAQARLSGLYMVVAFDSELNGWTLIGGGKLEYDQGGVTFADYKLTLSDAYVVGKRRTHRPARRVQAYDIRLSTVARDIEGLVYSTAFASTPAVVEVALPHGVSNVQARDLTSLAVARTVNTADGGSATILTGAANGDVLSFEQPEEDETYGDVVIYDRRGVLAPAELMKAVEPQATFGWEEVYGPDYPLSASDVPVLSNGVCRVRFLSSPIYCFAIDEYNGTEWVERSRTVPFAGTTAMTSIIFVAVKEWTPERGVIMVRLLGGGKAIDVYLALQRGWSGPQFQGYTRPGETSRPVFVYAPSDSNKMLFANSELTFNAEETGWTNSRSWSESAEPWGVLAPFTGGGIRHGFAVAVPPSAFAGAENTSAYGSLRYSIRFEGSLPSSVNTGWVGFRVRLNGTEPVRIFEAEPYKSGSGTVTEVSDAEASGGKAINDTQTAETNPTLGPTAPATIGLVAGSKYAFYARARVVTSGTAKMRVGSGGPTGATVAEFTNTTYQWKVLGLLTQAGTSAWQLDLWRTTAGSARVDRIIAVPYGVESKDSLGDFGSASLYDACGVAELVTR